MTAVALRRAVEEAGGTLRASHGDLVVRMPAGTLAPALVLSLRARKAELVGLLRGDLCRHCGEVMNWPSPVGVMFADGTGAHHACHERAEVERIRARAANAMMPAALADEAEVTARGEELP